MREKAIDPYVGVRFMTVDDVLFHLLQVGNGFVEVVEVLVQFCRLSRP